MTQRLGVSFASVLFALAIAACNAGSPSASPSTAASVGASASASASIGPSAAASVAEPFSPVSSSNLFSLLPAELPADFVPKIACAGTIGASDPVAVVRMVAAVEGTGEIVLRDYADISKPTTVCTFGSEYIFQLIDARHVVLGGGSGIAAVVDLPEVRYHWFQLPAGGELLTVGPQLDRVLWRLPYYEGPGTDKIYLTTASGDSLIASLPTPGGGRCGSPESDSRQGAYTLSGRHFFALNQPTLEFNSLVVGAAEAALFSVAAPSTGWPGQEAPMMALWSPTTETLYYRQSGDIWNWNEGSDPQLFLAGAPWVQPTISADGTHLAYSVLRPDGVLHDVYLVDLASGGSPQKIGAGPRKVPSFVNSTQLYFRSEGEDHGCVGAEQEKPLIYNILDGSESPSVIDGVLAAWPAT
jgi:hypothetical protein